MARNKGFSSFLKGLFTLITLLAMAALCYVGIVMLTGQFDGMPAYEPQGAAVLQPGQTGDHAALERIFGYPLPSPGQYPMQGQAANVPFNGQNARRAVQQYEGFTITAVAPAHAAPLLLESRLSLSTEEGLTLCGYPAVLSADGTAYCLYFSTEDAAYALYAPKTSRESFLSLAEKIHFLP